MKRAVKSRTIRLIGPAIFSVGFLTAVSIVARVLSGDPPVIGL
jgi:hypothetical protein